MPLMQEAGYAPQEQPPVEQPPMEEAPPAGPQEPPMPSGPPGDEGEVSPEQIELILDKSYQIVYGGDTKEGDLSSPILDLLRGSGGNANDPIQSLADAAAHVVSKVITSAQANQISLDPAAAFAVMMELVGELADVATKESLYDYGQDEVNAAAVRSGETLYALTKDSGFFKQEEMVGDVYAITQASQSGEMDKAITGMEQSPSGPPMGQPLMGGMQ